MFEKSVVVYQIFLPHPNPPLMKGRELDFLVFHFVKGEGIGFSCFHP